MSDAGLLRVTYEGTTLAFRPDEIVTIGRHPDSSVHVAGQRVSRRHATLSYQDGVWVVEDDGSANGTYAAGAPIRRSEVRGTLQIAIGDVSGPFVTLVSALDTHLEDAPTEAVAASFQPEATGSTKTRRSDRTVVTVGRAPDNDIVVADSTVSWHHAEIRSEPDGGYELVDLSSHNGTFLNGERVSRARLRELDRVTTGDRAFRFHGDKLEPLS